MAISAYVGLPGHGKSYGVVENILVPALKLKRVIYTNIPMNKDLCIERYDCSVIQFDVKDIAENPNWFTEVFEKGALFVFDEVPKLWPAGLKANQMLEQHREFLAEHRHMVGAEGFSTEIVLVVQKLNMISAFPRALIENTFWVVKHTKMGLNSRYRVDIYSGAMDGSNPQLSKREREIQGKFKKEIFELYQSHTHSQSGQAGNETKIDNRGNMFKGASIKIGLVVFILCAFGAWYGLQEVGKSYGMIEETPETAKNEEIKKTPEQKAQPVKVVEKIATKDSFLSSVDKIVFSHSLTKRSNGQYTKTDFFSVMRGTSQAFITNDDLMTLGYTIKTITECLFFVSNKHFSEFVMCEKTERDKSFFENLATRTTEP